MSSDDTPRATPLDDHGEFWVVSMPASLPELDVLSVAEREVVWLAAVGHSDNEISRARGTSIRTVRNQLQSAYRKLDVNSRTELSALILP